MNVGRYLRGEDRHVGTSRTVEILKEGRMVDKEKDKLIQIVEKHVGRVIDSKIRKNTYGYRFSFWIHLNDLFNTSYSLQRNGTDLAHFLRKIIPNCEKVKWGKDINRINIFIPSDE